MSFGVDYSLARPPLWALKAAGVTFIVRYLSWLPNPKVIDRAEAEAILAAGFDLVLNWEYDARDMLGGRKAGEIQAAEADRQCAELGLPGVPVIFSNDNDSTPGDQAAIDAYLDGCAAVRGLHLLGMYGGYWPVSRARAAGKATYWWGAGRAWSLDPADPAGVRTMWDTVTWQPHIMQGGGFMGQLDADWSHAADFGQTPRPGPAPKPPPPVLDWQVTMMTHLPTLALGAHGDPVRRAQALLNAAGARPALALDGQFGGVTHAAVEAFQPAHHLAKDGVVGPHTWAVLVTGADL